MRKSTTFKALCLLCAFVFAGFGAKAQFSHLETSIFFPCFNVPTGDFGSTVSKTPAVPLMRTDIGKEAGFGFGAGLRAAYKFDIGFGEVAPFVGAELFFNRLKSDIRDEYDNFNDGKAPFYFNIPVLFGVNYRYQINEIFTPFLEFGFGPDLMMVTKEAYTDALTNNDMELKYKSTIALAWQVGGGTYLKQHFSLGVHYYGFGSHKMRYKSSSDINDNSGIEKRGIGSLVLRIGFHF